jgi:hypothetical protein
VVKRFGWLDRVSAGLLRGLVSENLVIRAERG